MDIRKLEVFCKVVELKSFTKTAEAVLLSQPTVSEHIRTLENELDQKLVDRLGRQVQPTPVGRLLYGYASKILRLHHETLQAVEQYCGNLSGRIAMGASTIPGTYILPELISAFCRQHDDIKASVSISGSRDIARKVLEGEFDLGIIGAVWNERGLEFTSLFTDKLIIALPPGHALTGRKVLAINELIQEDFILREPGSGTRKTFAQILEQQGFKENNLREIATFGSTAAIREAVKAGIGISILSHRSVAEDSAAGKLAVAQLQGIAMDRTFHLISRKNREMPPVAAAFTRYLLEQATTSASAG